MSLNSSDYQRLRYGSVQESEAQEPSTPAPSPELIQMRKQLEELTKKLEIKDKHNENQNAQLMRHMQESQRKQDILRNELLSVRQPAVKEAPAAGTEQPSTWAELLGLEGNNQAGEEETTMSNAQRGNAKVYTEDELEAWAAQREQKKAEQQREAQRQLNEKIAEVREDFQQQHSDIAQDERANTFFKSTVDEIYRINPSLDLKEIYQMAITKTRETQQLFAGPQKKEARQQQRQESANPYTMQSQPRQQQRPSPNDPFSNLGPSMSQEESLAERKKEIEQIRRSHMSKFHSQLR